MRLHSLLLILVALLRRKIKTDWKVRKASWSVSEHLGIISWQSNKQPNYMKTSIQSSVYADLQTQ